MAAYATAYATALQHCDEELALREANAAMKRRLVALGRVAAIKQRFAACSDAAPDIADIASLAASLAEKPCGIATANRRVVARESTEGAAEFFPRIFDADVASHPEVAAPIAAIPPASQRSSAPTLNATCSIAASSRR